MNIDDKWFDDKFNPDTPHDLKVASKHIVCLYNIRGTCDPMWIANLIAIELGRGDGNGRFFNRISPIPDRERMNCWVVFQLATSYRKCVEVSGKHFSAMLPIVRRVS